LLLVFPKEHHLGLQNGFESLGPKKMPKIVNCAIIKEIERHNCRGPSGIGGWPPTSPWINMFSIDIMMIVA